MGSSSCSCAAFATPHFQQCRWLPGNGSKSFSVANRIFRRFGDNIAARFLCIPGRKVVLTSAKPSTCYSCAIMRDTDLKIEHVDLLNTSDIARPGNLQGNLQGSFDSTAVVIIPGYGSDALQYESMRKSLADVLPGAFVSVAPVRGRTWIRTLGGRPVSPILSIIDRAVEDARREAGVERVTLVGHSAGGWIARIWLSRSAAYHGVVWRGADRAHALICLGTPQMSAEPVTRLNMQFVGTHCPDCAEAPDVEYICVAGTGLNLPELPKTDSLWRLRFWERTLWFARLSYELTDGSTDAVVGDGVVPTSVAFLPGARNISLGGIWHSPSSPGPWYGDPSVVSYWCQFVR